MLTLTPIPFNFTICQLPDYTQVNLSADFCFLSKTDEELSLVCLTKDVPANTVNRDDGWRAFRIQGILDFSLIGILSRIAGVLAERQIGIFAVSTYNTDYILVKQENFDDALAALGEAGYEIAGES